MNTNNSDYRFYINASEAAKGTKGRMMPGTSFYAFRMFAKSMNESIRKDWAAKEAEKAEYAKDHNAKAIEKKFHDADTVFADYVTGKKEMLTRILDKLASNTQRAFEKFTMIPPRPESITKIDLADKRFDTMSETEFLLLAEDCASNYQESSYLQAVAKKHGKDYKIPFEPGEAKENLNLLVSIMKRDVIAHIDDDPVENLALGTYFAHKDGGEIYGYINLYSCYFDDLPVFVQDESDIIPELTDRADIENNLVAARKVCWENGLKSLWNDAVNIGYDIQKNGLTLDNITKAEKIITVVNEMYPSGDDEQK